MDKNFNVFFLHICRLLRSNLWRIFEDSYPSWKCVSRFPREDSCLHASSLYAIAHALLFSFYVRSFQNQRAHSQWKICIADALSLAVGHRWLIYIIVVGTESCESRADIHSYGDLCSIWCRLRISYCERNARKPRFSDQRGDRDTKEYENKVELNLELPII